MSKPLLVTAADKNYLEKAKQVFAGAYFNAGWKGDFMLLAHDIPEKDLKWFRKKGVLVKHCRLLGRGLKNLPNYARLEVFKYVFKKWSQVVYVDTDVIIRGSLDDLLTTETFGGVENNANLYSRSLEVHLYYPSEVKKLGIKKTLYDKLIQELKTRYSLRTSTFCDGVFVFNTKVIKKETFTDLISLADRYCEISRSISEELALNLYFFNKWEKISPIYDFYINNGKNPWLIKPARIKAIILHFQGDDKPWNEKNRFFKEWRKNYQAANKIDLKKRIPGKIWSEKEIKKITLILNTRGQIVTLIFKTAHFLSGVYYKTVSFFEHKFPKQFLSLKQIKERLLS